MDVRSLYDCDQQGIYFCVYDYQPMIDSFGKVLVQVADEDYSGDTRVLLQNNGQIGLIVFGWGSCSGCDALQACRNYEDLQNLYDSLESSIQWWDSAEEALDYFNKHDWKGDYSGFKDETSDFVKQCKEFLSKTVEILNRVEASSKTQTCENNSASCESQDCCLQTYVWENVCCDYTPGIVVAVAKNVKEALEMVREQSRFAYNEVKNIDPIVCGTRSRVFIVMGGS